MIRRLTVACGLLTLAVLFGLAVQGRSLSGARTSHQNGGVQVTVIPDRPAFWPPVKPVPPEPPLKGLPPAPQPKPLHGATAPASPARRGEPATTFVQVANVLFNLPKIIHDQTQGNRSR
ncbi:MAG TPA: hypothetical protein VJT33_00720 [bacterium]|nr:hypothetical protein [bacterium]